MDRLRKKLIGKKSNYSLDFLTFVEEQGLSFLLQNICGVKLFSEWDGTSDNTKKIFFVIPDPMRSCKIFEDRYVFFSFLKPFLHFENLNFVFFCPIWVKFVKG